MRRRVVLVGLVVAGCSDVLGLPDPRPLELGADCTGSGGGDLSQCPAGTDQCIPFQQGSNYQCTISCGTGPDGSGSSAAVPPAGGDRLCATLVTTGTPRCAAGALTSPGVVTWYCAVQCDTAAGQGLGSCPTGLACIDGFCQ